ncbi:hypothetical protein H6F76_27360 [Leptolyngbya sp. FACHB-321]|nr:hypothetical protein [Leptolyngbya sp. FACHB-321]MBD2038677.1 hypothetical protein [Leptolyngbya sp. FACHB-321]
MNLDRDERGDRSRDKRDRPLSSLIVLVELLVSVLKEIQSSRDSKV